ncbi:DASH complex subunit Dad2-domain-containing protein [Syncephalis fuscata]|nr:DASH complex subunit Dad2-domain-containing protein [Syncephalis fuscata]
MSLRGQQSGSALAPPIHIQLEEKQRELQGLLAIRDLSRGLHNYMETLCERIDELNSGYEAISQVMGNWQNVFRDMNLVEAQKKAQQIQNNLEDNRDMDTDEQTANDTEERNRMIVGTQLVLLPLHGQDTAPVSGEVS